MALVFKYIWLGLYLWHMIHKLGNNILCRLVLYDKVYGFGNTSLFEVGNRHDAWQGSTYNPK
jgi:hypothetical protein